MTVQTDASSSRFQKFRCLKTTWATPTHLLWAVRHVDPSALLLGLHKRGTRPSHVVTGVATPFNVLQKRRECFQHRNVLPVFNVHLCSTFKRWGLHHIGPRPCIKLASQANSKTWQGIWEFGQSFHNKHQKAPASRPQNRHFGLDFWSFSLVLQQRPRLKNTQLDLKHTLETASHALQDIK